MAFGLKILLSELDAAFDAQTSTLSQIGVGDKAQPRTVHTGALVDSTTTPAISARTFAWTQTDDQELLAMFLRVSDTVAGRTVKVTLTVDSGDTRFIGDNTVSISLVTINGTVDSRPTSLDLRPPTGVRIRLKKGVRYRLTLENTTAGTTVAGPVDGGIVVLGKRRRR